MKTKLKVGPSPFRDTFGREAQPLRIDDLGIVRFRENAIVSFLLARGGHDMNALARLHFSDEDRAQFAQLIGYSVNGYGELSCVPLAQARLADEAAHQLLAKGGAA